MNPIMTHYPSQPLTLIDRLFGIVDQPFRFHRGGHDHDAFPDASDDTDVLAALRKQAHGIHEEVVHDQGIFALEFLGATGSGKTRIIERLVEGMFSDLAIGAIVGDVAGDDDASRLRDLGVSVVNVNTGKECHLDAGLVKDAIDDFDLTAIDVLFLENVGNMVCPADFPLGAQARVLVVSTTEGDDVVRKHPRLFQEADVAVINKTDIAAAVDADVDRMVADVSAVNPDLETIPMSAKTRENMDSFVEALRRIRADDPHVGPGDHIHSHSHSQHADQ